VTTGAQLPSVLAVGLNGRRVGQIARLPGDRQLFTFEEEYAEDPLRPTLSLSYKARTGGLLTAVRPVSRRLPPFFSNLLPEGHLRTYLAGLAGVNPQREFFLLAALGADLPGATTVTPIGADGTVAPTEETLEGHPPAGSRRGGALRFSLAGVQLKFSAVLEAAGGLTVPAQGVGGSWIVKLPSTRFEAVPENEFVILALARAAGVETPRNRLVPVSAIGGLPAEAAALAGNALVVERFDRGPAGQRIHMEDFAQVFGSYPEDKYKAVSYANIARVLWAEAGEAGVLEFVRRLVFSVLTGNCDMHLKNWSLLYPDGRVPVLSPAYDLLSTLPYIPGDGLALTFGGSRTTDEVGIDQLRRVADRAGLPFRPLVRTALDTAESTADAWGKLEQKDLLPTAIRTAIDGQIAAAAARTTRSLAAALSPRSRRAG
jgi:serine/threonine-protein kinase HipA